MNQYFIASIVDSGILGGGITADDEGITYHTNKLTVPDRLKNLSIRFADIQDYSKRGFLLFYVYTIRTAEEEYRFLIFNSNGFESVLSAGLNKDAK